MSPGSSNPVLVFALACTILILGIWLLYPLLVGVAARLVRRRAIPASGDRPRVSVIFATRDTSAAIRDRVANLLASEYPADRIEVVVGLDAMRTTADPVQETPRVRVVSGAPPGGKAASLNAAVAIAAGEILVFADTAQRFAPNAIRTLVDALAADDRLGAVSGALQIGADGRIGSPAELYWRLEKWLRANEARIHSTVGVTGAIYAQRRAAWKPIPVGVILDDVYSPMRMVLDGWRVGFCESAIATDERRFGANQEYARKVRTLTGVMQLCAWLPAILVPIRNPIWLQLVCHKLLRLLTPYLLAMAVIATLVALPSLVSRVVLPRLPEGAAPTLAFVSALIIFGPLVFRRVRAALHGVLAMQMAVVQATVNGLRGRWDVWS